MHISTGTAEERGIKEWKGTVADNMDEDLVSKRSRQERVDKCYSLPLWNLWGRNLTASFARYIPFLPGFGDPIPESTVSY